AWGLPANAEAFRTLIDKGGRDAGFSIRHGRTQGSANQVSVRIYLENEPHPHEPYQVRLKPPNPVEFNDRWHHYACTYDGQPLILHVDGQAVDTLSKESKLDLT
ncbi:MAG: LamG-like jellyroll fold domain-containing protein, partial [Kiritimatiellia bacterium]